MGFNSAFEGLKIALHVSRIIITDLQKLKTTVTTASDKNKLFNVCIFLGLLY
jgi:hypothetical protein